MTMTGMILVTFSARMLRNSYSVTQEVDDIIYIISTYHSVLDTAPKIRLLMLAMRILYTVSTNSEPNVFGI